MDSPLSSRNNDAIQTWTESLRPTTKLRGISSQSYPLRVIDCMATLRSGRVVCSTPTSWDFAVLSHRWGRVPEWPVFPRPWPSRGNMMVSAADFNSIMKLAKLVPELTNLQCFWVDCICIDQESQLEQSREILNMGIYYSLAKKCLILPDGLELDRVSYQTQWV